MQSNSENRSRYRVAALLLLAVCGLLAVSPAAAQETESVEPEQRRVRGDRISIFSGDVTVPADVYRQGSIVCVGGKVTIEGRVSRDVVVVLGSLELTGEIEGAVNLVLSESEVNGGVIGREVINVLGKLQLVDSVVDGELISVLSNFSNIGSDVANQFILPGFGFGGGQHLILWFRLFWLFIAFVMVLLLTALVPERIRLIGQEAPVRYVSAFFVGILGYLGMLIVVSLLMATVIGIPLAIVGFWALQWMGVAGIFYAIGRRFGRTFGIELSILGAVLLTFVIYAVLKLAPTPLGFWGLGISLTLWTLFFFLVQLPAIGLVILTRFGTRPGARLVSAGGPPVDAAPPPAATPEAPPTHWESPPPPDAPPPTDESQENQRKDET